MSDNLAHVRAALQTISAASPRSLTSHVRELYQANAVIAEALMVISESSDLIIDVEAEAKRTVISADANVSDLQTQGQEVHAVQETHTDTEDLLRRFKELKAADAAEAHDERDHGRFKEAHGERSHSDHRPRSASSKRSSSIFVLIARYREIVDESIARLAKLEELAELETHASVGHEPEEREIGTPEQDTPEQDTPEQDTPEQDTVEQDTPQQVSSPPSQGHVTDQIPAERRRSGRRTQSSNLRFLCLLPQLGKNMVATIQQARTALSCHNVDERGYLILQVQKCWDASELAQLLRGAGTLDPKKIKEITGFELAQGDADCLHAKVAAEMPLNLCDIKEFGKASAYQQPKEEFEEWIARPPGRVQYLICKPLSDHSINTLLDAGPQCNRRPEIPGVNRPYWYVSCEPNTPATLHIEDGNTGSANLLLAGAEKHWIIVHRSSAEKLERSIRDQFPSSRRCSQFVRHHNVIVGPQWLEKRGIDFEIVCQKPGDVLVTLPGRVYHEVRNTGKNFAAAINYEFTDAPDDPADYVWCEAGQSKCGKNVLTRQSFMPDVAARVMGFDDETPPTTSKRKQQEFDDAKSICKRPATLARHPSNRRVHTSRPSSTPFPASVPVPIEERLLEAVLDQTALHSCVTLIRAWRSQLTRIELASAASDRIARLAASDTRIRLAQNRSWLDALHLKSAQYAFASDMSSKRNGAFRLDSSVYDKILEAQGLVKTTKKDREQLRKRVTYATKIFQICQGFGHGLLCLLPLTGVPENYYYSMTNASIEAFQGLAAEKRTLLEARCKVGVFIQDMFVKDVEFAFEYKNVTSFDGLSEAKMLALLRPVSYPKVNFYTPARGWPRPPSWQWDWPQDPTWAPSSTCEICGLIDCICLADLHHIRHRIVDYGLKGRGIQARATTNGGLAFKEGDYIQELVGEVKPLDWPSGSYTSVDLERPDVGVTCRLCCKEKSNWARLVNHSCDPCAEMTVKIVSGRARLMLRARRDIWDGMEITVNYGKSFPKEEARLCAICIEQQKLKQ
ncbi:hypothetical protein J4E91_011254 [Alternaria rosae]|nr:hypothetical protein J4E91_011254 [Alternaria rosae]